MRFNSKSVLIVNCSTGEFILNFFDY